ncbi:TetR/AcrR family transcriptional regulator [Pseudomonas lurida]|uniref:Helix-turn-helix domain containing protein n=1 Tax=Pseudomonas lurida TaxID=244566 RepID=A0ABY9FSQ0_9PSED|nr:TetR/AcrR family transcriptional regulator [Pseudomonas lurida]MBC3235091.1 TetR/AcrR family transcriptional regulator [Pseudomonas lurida]WLH06301.1 helix-turn-helix domain containing protein [Pseudomonas lurida]
MTKSELNAEIIDRAAGLFAKHGFAHTSLQQIADAVSYSKAGLLHHFPSKQALYDAALRTGIEHMQVLVESVEGQAPGVERERAVIENLVDFTFDWPGVSAFANRLVEGEQSDAPELMQMGLLVYVALGIDLATATQERLVRVTSALTGLGATSLVAVRSGIQREWRSLIILAAMDALGHHGFTTP